MCAGNINNDDINGYAKSPAMAYNAITVGGYDDKNTVSNTDDTMYALNAYHERVNTNRAEKPNIIAPANNISSSGYSNHGTSFATPQVAGVVAEICSSNSTLKVKQTAVCAIIMAGAGRKINCTNKGQIGQNFSLYSISGSSQISDQEGAGKLDAVWSQNIVKKGDFYSYSTSTTSLPITKNLTISSANNSVVRVVIFWNRNMWQARKNQDLAEDWSVTDNGMPNLNLMVLDSSGNVIASSTTLYSNYEIVQFKTNSSGEYRIKIGNVTPQYTNVTNIGMAVIKIK